MDEYTLQLPAVQTRMNLLYTLEALLMAHRGSVIKGKFISIILFVL